MRLDHLLSKETSSEWIFTCNVLRSEQGVRKRFTLFNLEGTEKKAPEQEEKDQYGPIAQLARAHD